MDERRDKKPKRNSRTGEKMIEEPIPYFKPPYLEAKKILPQIEEIINTRMYTKGIHRDELETQLSEYLGVDHVITTSSGTMAIFIGLRVLHNLYRFKHVGMPSFNWSSDRIAAEMSNFDITYIDINRDTWLIDENYEPYKTRGPYDIDLILDLDTFGSRSELCDHTNIPLIMDSTHSLGNKGVGSRGLLECFSLAATKPVTACEGGFITTNDPKIAKKAIEIRDMTSRLPEISCVIALGYLKQLPENIKAKRATAQYYRTHLPFQFQKIEHDSTFSKICFLCEDSEGIIKRAEAGVECRKYYKPLVELENTDRVYERIVCLPAWVGVDYKRVTEKVL